MFLGFTSSYAPLKKSDQSASTHKSKALPDGQPFVRVFKLQIVPHTLYRDIDFGFSYTSFVFEIDDSTNFTHAAYQTEENEIFKLDSLPPSDQPGEERRSPFIIPNNIQHRFTFYSGDLKGDVKIYLFYAPPIVQPANKHFKTKPDVCDKPNLVRGSVWREGLPKPKGTRKKHEVNHCVIHHAASSNSNHDYINVVRNIYLLHTQTNGWDDIGYNFIIAQDGSIYEGREHQKIDSTDNIKGAHFCGKNSGTMGICVLGNYESIAPTKLSITALKHLLTWKCYKDGINPLGKSNHPSGSSSQLQHIAGHQDGCATACPGDSLYRLLPIIRSEVDSLIKTCGSANVEHNAYLQGAYWHLDQVTKTVYVQYPSTEVKSATLHNVYGQQVWKNDKIHSGNVFKIPGLKDGTYVLRLLSPDNQRYTTKILVH